MKKWLLALLAFLPVYLIFSFYFLDRSYFLSPVEYKRDFIIRNDSRGDGYFGAGRNGRRVHQGLDLSAKIGTPVLAARSGIVAVAKQNNGMGKYVIIKHLGKMVTIYGHLSEICAVKGQFVRQGQMIGRIGKTGNSNHPAIQPHLHFEVRVDGVPCDPMEYLR
ncbi:MAG: M23 family metallopeptidase [Candidatus Omnitrophica bacterium]|nr:M23 family metallopeptidase [Candidatus Omnitrophota bacterium]